MDMLKAWARMSSVNKLQEPINNQAEEAALAAFKDIGQLLSEARTEKNLTIKQVASKIHIRQRYLIDLEEGNLSDLPGRVYVFGFIRNYARLLDLDGEELIRRVNALPSLSNYEHGHAPIPIPSEEEPSYLILSISAAIIVVLSIGGYLFLKPTSKQTPEVVEIESDEDNQPVTSVKQESLAPASLEQNPAPLTTGQPAQVSNDVAAQPNPEATNLGTQEKQGGMSQMGDKNVKETESSIASKQVTLKASEPSWVEVRDDANRILFMRVMKRGEEYVVPDKPGITFSTGNAGGMKIYVGQTELPSLGNRGEVKRGISIETFQK